MNRTCKICNHQSSFIFDSLVLNKYLVKYYKCVNCRFIQTEDPYWLNEAYSSPIGLLDVGLLQRNLLLSEKISEILDLIIPHGGRYLDYGGGYGTFVRLMRDRGYDFYLFEIYVENLFAKYFELKDSENKTDFNCLTAFEVFEHLVNPIEEIEKMFTFSDTIIFSTELQPNNDIISVSDWWYFVPDGGQHISLYSLNSLIELQKHFNCHFYTNKFNLHIFSKILLKDPFENVKPPSYISKIKNRIFKLEIQNKNNSYKRESFLNKDFEYYKTKLTDGKI